MNYTILRFEKRKKLTEIVAMSNHNYRHKTVPNADPKRRHLNRCLLGSDDIEADILKYLQTLDLSVDKDLRKNGVIAVEALLAFSPQWIKNPDGSYTYDAKKKLCEWIQRSVRWLKNEFGNNVVNIVLHCDESNFHIHATLGVAYWNERWQKYRLSADKFFGSKQKLANMQTSYAKEFEDIGLHRGIEGSKATHQDVSEFYREIEEARVLSRNYSVRSPGLSPVKLTKWKHAVAELSDEAVEYHEQRYQQQASEAAYWKRMYCEQKESVTIEPLHSVSPKRRLQ